MSTTDNTLADMVNSAISDALTLGEGVVEAAIIADLPILGYPGFKQLLELILGWVEGYFLTQASDAATKIVIDIQVNAEESTVTQAFKGAQQAIQSGDANAITQASQNLDSAFGSIIHSDGSASA